jgi:hypothetical protein
MGFNLNLKYFVDLYRRNMNIPAFGDYAGHACMMPLNGCCSNDGLGLVVTTEGYFHWFRGQRIGNIPVRGFLYALHYNARGKGGWTGLLQFINGQNTPTIIQSGYWVNGVFDRPFTSEERKL